MSAPPYFTCHLTGSGQLAYFGKSAFVSAVRVCGGAGGPVTELVVGTETFAVTETPADIAAML